MIKRVLANILGNLFLMFFLVSCEKTIVTDEKMPDGSENTSDYDWSGSDVVSIKLNSNSVSADGKGVSVSGSVVTILSSGTYHLTGGLTNGQVIVNTRDTGIVRLIFSGVSINCSNSAPVFIKKSPKTIIVLADNTKNYLTDGKTYLLDSNQEPSAAIFSKSYLSFFGNGSLTVNAYFNNGITGKDGLVIKSGTFIINSVDDAIRGKDYLVIHSGDVTINAGGDGLKSDNISDIDSGHVVIESGVFRITSGDVGIRSESWMAIKGGIFDVSTSGSVSFVTSGTGYDPSYPAGLKSKTTIDIGAADLKIVSSGKAGRGIFADKNINMTSGTLKVSTSGQGELYKNVYGVQDAAHASCLKANGNINIFGGSVTLSSSGSGGTGIACDGDLTFGDPSTSSSVEITTTGIKLQISPDDFAEAKGVSTGGTITIKGGSVTISSADDGLKSDRSVIIKNGKVVINNTGGDSFDCSSGLVITGGTVLVNGPLSVPEPGLEKGSCIISGGFLAGSGMKESMDMNSQQYSLKIESASNISSSDLLHIEDEAGQEILTFKSSRDYNTMVLSSAALMNGSKYFIYTGGSSSGTYSDGIFKGGEYSGGNLRGNFTISSMVTGITF